MMLETQIPVHVEQSLSDDDSTSTCSSNSLVTTQNSATPKKTSSKKRRERRQKAAALRALYQSQQPENGSQTQPAAAARPKTCEPEVFQAETASQVPSSQDDVSATPSMEEDQGTQFTPKRISVQKVVSPPEVARKQPVSRTLSQDGFSLFSAENSQKTAVRRLILEQDNAQLKKIELPHQRLTQDDGIFQEYDQHDKNKKKVEQPKLVPAQALKNKGRYAAVGSAIPQLDLESKQAERYKTEMCRSWNETGNCRYGDKCQFAHGDHELRTVERHIKYKSDLCYNYHYEGICLYGIRCCFVHNISSGNMGRACAQNIDCLRMGHNSRLPVFQSCSVRGTHEEDSYLPTGTTNLARGMTFEEFDKMF